MRRAYKDDKPIVVDILANSFKDNKSVNYIIRHAGSRKKRLLRLMEYSFDYCMLFGEIYLSDDKKACALVVLPEKKETNFISIMLDSKLALSCIGIFNLLNVLKRESKIKTLQPKIPMYYLWFIGVQSEDQHMGRGSSLLRELITRSDSVNRPIYLETSTLKNIPWYEKFGFHIYEELDLGYKLFFLKREN